MGKAFEIRSTRNGYIIFPDGFAHHTNRTDPWVFESLDGALDFLRTEFEPKENNPEIKGYTDANKNS